MPCFMKQYTVSLALHTDISLIAEQRRMKRPLQKISEFNYSNCKSRALDRPTRHKRNSLCGQIYQTRPKYVSQGYQTRTDSLNGPTRHSDSLVRPTRQTQTPLSDLPDKRHPA